MNTELALALERYNHLRHSEMYNSACKIYYLIVKNPNNFSMAILDTYKYQRVHIYKQN